MSQRFQLHRTDASEHIALEIRRYVERADLRPGDRLGTEAELAAEFGVSRPTLREALRLLAGSHLIRAIPGRNGGIFVASTPHEGVGRALSASVATMLAAESVSVDDLMQARMVMEAPLAGLAAAHHDEETLARLTAAMDVAGEHPLGSPAFNDADADFHRAIAAAAGNDVLVGFTSWTLDVLQPHLADEISPRVSKSAILEQHRAILDAIRAADAPTAEAAMRAHLAYLCAAVAARVGP